MKKIMKKSGSLNFSLSGMCVIAVHLRRSPGLASHLRIHEAPNILGIVSGRITFYKENGISFDHLREFVKQFFPSGTLTMVNINYLKYRHFFLLHFVLFFFH